MDTASISIPRKVRVVVGPSTFAGSTGSPSLMAVWIARSRVCWQVAWLAPDDEVVQIVCEVDNVGAYHSPCETISNSVENDRG